MSSFIRYLVDTKVIQGPTCEILSKNLDGEQIGSEDTVSFLGECKFWPKLNIGVLYRGIRQKETQLIEGARWRPYWRNVASLYLSLRYKPMSILIIICIIKFAQFW